MQFLNINILAKIIDYWHRCSYQRIILTLIDKLTMRLTPYIYRENRAVRPLITGVVFPWWHGTLPFISLASNWNCGRTNRCNIWDAIIVCLYVKLEILSLVVFWYYTKIQIMEVDLISQVILLNKYYSARWKVHLPSSIRNLTVAFPVCAEMLCFVGPNTCNISCRMTFKMLLLSYRRVNFNGTERFGTTLFLPSRKDTLTWRHFSLPPSSLYQTSSHVSVSTCNFVVLQKD